LFPGVEIKGGVLYFLWDRDNRGTCATITRREGDSIGPVDRVLNRFDVFVRDARALPILEKILNKDGKSFSELVSPRDPFGPDLVSNFTKYRKIGKPNKGDLKLYMNKNKTRVTEWVDPKYATRNLHLVKKWKLLVPKAGSDGGQKLPDVVLGKPLIASPGSVCTSTYIVIGPFDLQTNSNSAESYYRTRFFRFLISLRKVSQNTTQSTYTWVPQQTWDRTWTDAALYKKYGITKEEQEYIESMVKEMPA